MTYRPSILLVLVALFAPMAGAQSPQAVATPIEVGQRISIWSETLQESRPLQIYVPPSQVERHAPAAVLYVLDGDGNFLHTAAAVQFLTEAGRIPEMIVVAISNTDRARDLTPTLPGCTQDCGGSDRFLTFLTHELMPWVDGRYHTAPFRIIAGHSRGGLYVMNTLLNQPDAFNAYIAMSPALWQQDKAVLKGAQEKLKRLPPRRFLYMTDGDEAESLTSTVAEAVALIKRAAPANLEWSYAHLANEQHMTTPHRSMYDGLEHIFSGMQVPRPTILAQGIAGIDAHYAKLPARYGFDIALPFGMADWCGYYLLQQNKPQMAVEVFQRNVANHPGMAAAYYSLSSALQAAKRPQDAQQAMTKAYLLSTQR
jgi:predicted alpha/beta superfamily hydrolase